MKPRCGVCGSLNLKAVSDSQNIDRQTLQFRAILHCNYCHAWADAIQLSEVQPRLRLRVPPEVYRRQTTRYGADEVLINRLWHWENRRYNAGGHTTFRKPVDIRFFNPYTEPIPYLMLSDGEYPMRLEHGIHRVDTHAIAAKLLPCTGYESAYHKAAVLTDANGLLHCCIMQPYYTDQIQFLPIFAYRPMFVLYQWARMFHSADEAASTIWEHFQGIDGWHQSNGVIDFMPGLVICDRIEELQNDIPLTLRNFPAEFRRLALTA